MTNWKIQSFVLPSPALLLCDRQIKPSSKVSAKKGASRRMLSAMLGWNLETERFASDQFLVCHWNSEPLFLLMSLINSLMEKSQKRESDSDDGSPNSWPKQLICPVVVVISVLELFRRSWHQISQMNQLSGLLPDSCIYLLHPKRCTEINQTPRLCTNGQHIFDHCFGGVMCTTPLLWGWSSPCAEFHPSTWPYDTVYVIGGFKPTNMAVNHLK